MNGSFRRNHRFSWLQVAGDRAYGILKCSFKNVDALFVLRVTVWWRNTRPRWDFKFEHSNATRLRCIDKVANRQLAYFDRGVVTHCQLSQVGGDEGISGSQSKLANRAPFIQASLVVYRRNAGHEPRPRAGFAMGCGRFAWPPRAWPASLADDCSLSLTLRPFAHLAGAA